MMPMTPDLQNYLTRLLGSLGVGGMNGLTWPANPPQGNPAINDPWMSGPITDGHIPGVSDTPAKPPVAMQPPAAGGPPPGMGWRRPGFPGQGNAYGRMARFGTPPTTPPVNTGITGRGIADPSQPGQVTSGPISGYNPTSGAPAPGYEGTGGGYPLAPSIGPNADQRHVVMPPGGFPSTSTTTPATPKPVNFGQTMSAWAHSKPDRPDNFSGAWGQSSQMDSWRNRQPTHAGFATKPVV